MVDASLYSIMTCYIVDIPIQNLIRVRWACGNVVLALLSFVLNKYSFTIYLLPYLSVGVAIHAFYGFLVGRKQTKVGQITMCGMIYKWDNIYGRTMKPVF